jgi:hypothetical protein
MRWGKQVKNGQAIRADMLRRIAVFKQKADHKEHLAASLEEARRQLESRHSDAARTQPSQPPSQPPDSGGSAALSLRPTHGGGSDDDDDDAAEGWDW